MQMVSKATHEGQLNLFLHKFEAAVYNSGREGHCHKTSNAVEEALVALHKDEI